MVQMKVEGKGGNPEPEIVTVDLVFHENMRAVLEE